MRYLGQDLSAAAYNLLEVGPGVDGLKPGG
jgi:hypothetical protein